MKRKNEFATSIKLNACAYIVSGLASETFLALNALSDKGLYHWLSSNSALLQSG